MDQQRERIQADLRGLLAGEVFCDDAVLAMYSSDASIYQVRPLCVVRPRGLADVQAAVLYAAENTIPIHARGAGTGLAGESLGPGLVLDFSRAMRRIVSVENETATVQPGVVLGQLNRYLAAFGRQFGPDPATGGVTTMGSVLALDNSGSNWLRYGSARRHVLSLQVVLDDPIAVKVPRARRLLEVAVAETEPEPLVAALYRALADDHVPATSELPETLRGSELGDDLMARVLAINVKSEAYGTRSSTIVLTGAGDRRYYYAEGAPPATLERIDGLFD
jgi:FAD/FMN-containing dehydrogenase